MKKVFFICAMLCSAPAVFAQETATQQQEVKSDRPALRMGSFITEMEASLSRNRTDVSQKAFSKAQALMAKLTADWKKEYEGGAKLNAKLNERINTTKKLYSELKGLGEDYASNNKTIIEKLKAFQATL